MEKITTGKDLTAAIHLLEKKQAEEEKVLKKGFQQTFESLKPLNLIKSTLREAASSGELKDNLLNTSAGLSAGFLVKKLFVGRSRNPIRKTAGNIIMFGITNMMAKNPGVITRLGKKIWEIFRDKSTDQPALPFHPGATKKQQAITE